MVEAVRRGQFWIFTHPEYTHLVQLKMQDMVAAFPPLPEAVEPLLTSR